VPQNAETRDGEVTVDMIEQTDSGTVRALVRWGSAPGVSYVLEVMPDGRLIEFCARADAAGEVSARGLRKAPLGRMQAAVRSEVAEVVEGWRWSARKRNVRASLMEDIEALARDFLERERPGAAGRDDAHYAAIAAMYLDVLADPQRGTTPVLKILAERLGKSPKTVRNYLFEARERSLLTSLGRGRAGGQLTDKAKEILSGNHQAP
jgi:hypothetical protein